MAKKIQKRRIIIIILLTIIAIVAVVGLNLFFKATNRYDGNDVTIHIPRGADVDQLTDSLKANLDDAFADDVMSMWNKLPGDPVVRSGAYKIAHADKAIDVAKRLRNGRQTPVNLTFNNVRTLTDLADRIDPQMDISATEFLAAVDSISQSRGIAKADVPSLFLPDTYEVWWDEPASKLVDRLLSYHDKFWTDERKSKASALGLTPAQVTTLASIVEEETNKADERGKVARLYLNRLAQGMKLQADPTVKYAVGDFTLRRILSQHLSTPSPYNTYIYKGLPPGPIRIVDGRTIDAVLDAPHHDFIYMCAKEDFSGYHNFAKDYSTHMANARRYQSALNTRGIK